VILGHPTGHAHTQDFFQVLFLPQSSMGKNVSFCTLIGFREISATLLERMAGTTRLELATSAVTGTVFW
jgi:hypothetical protein